MDDVKVALATEESQWKLRVNARKIGKSGSPGTYVTK